MLTLAELESTVPEIAAPLRAKLEATGLCFLATLRRDGSPRVSPLEVSFLDGGLYVGSMPGAMKARDLQRDPRAALVTPLADKGDVGGEGKAFVHAVEITDPDAFRTIMGHAVEGIEGADLDDFGTSHLFELRFTGAAWQKLDGDAWDTLSWVEGGPVRHRRREGPAGEPVEID